MAKKIKTVNVLVNGKNFRFRFTPVGSDVNPEDILCEHCPLMEVCNNFKDPRDLTDETSSFNDFCLSGGNTDKSAEDLLNDEYMGDLIPSMEDFIKYVEEINQDVYNQLLESHPMVDLGKVIDCVCGPDGYGCSFYNQDHSECTSKNGLCILKTLFKV